MRWLTRPRLKLRRTRLPGATRIIPLRGQIRIATLTTALLSTTAQALLHVPAWYSPQTFWLKRSIFRTAIALCSCPQSFQLVSRLI
jgi:hypothetical protein